MSRSSLPRGDIEDIRQREPLGVVAEPCCSPISTLRLAEHGVDDSSPTIGHLRLSGVIFHSPTVEYAPDQSGQQSGKGLISCLYRTDADFRWQHRSGSAKKVQVVSQRGSPNSAKAGQTGEFRGIQGETYFVDAASQVTVTTHR